MHPETVASQESGPVPVAAGGRVVLFEAQAANCFSRTLILKVDGRPFGKVEARLFGESLDVQLLERRRLAFRKQGWLSAHFDLVDVDNDQVLGQAQRGGVFTSAWDLTLGKRHVK